MPEEHPSNPFSKPAIEQFQTSAAVEYILGVAQEITSVTNIGQQLSLSPKQVRLFELGLAVYLTNQQGGEAARLLRNPMTRAMAKIPLVSFIPAAIEHSQAEDARVINKLNGELQEIVESDIEAGEYMPRSVLNVANFVSALWIECRRNKPLFEEKFVQRLEYYRKTVLRKKSTDQTE